MARLLPLGRADLTHLSTPDSTSSSEVGARTTFYNEEAARRKRLVYRALPGVREAELHGAEAQAGAARKGCQNLPEE